MTLEPGTVASDDSMNLDETARIARDLIRIDTTNYGEGNSKGEAEAAAYVVAFLESLGLEPQTIESAPGRANVIVRIPGQIPELPALVLHGHLDVVPADPENWSVDPFGGVVKDGMLWGRGAVDMKDMDAMMLTAVAEILRTGERPRRDVILTFFADEEAGGAYGSHYLVEHHPELFAGAGTAVSEVGGYSIDIEGTRAYLIQTGEKGMQWLRLRARGVAAHGSRVIEDNALTHLAEAIAKIGRHDWPISLGETTRGLVDRIAEILGVDPVEADPEQIILRTGTGAGFLHASLRNTTNPTMLKAGYKHNVIPDAAEALIDVRTVPGQAEEVLATIRELVGPNIEIETVVSDVSLEAPFSGEIADAIRASLGRFDPEAEVIPYLLAAGTDNKALSKLGIAGYGFAPLRLPAELDFPGMFHGVDERVPLDALSFGHRVLTDFLRTY